MNTTSPASRRFLREPLNRPAHKPWLRAALAMAVFACLAARGGCADGSAWEAPLRAELNRMADRLTATLKPWEVPARIFRVEDYGAKADGQTLDTAAIQAAIDACSAAGGGVVLCAKGDFITGTLVLKSGVMLEVPKGARILGSVDLADYPDHVPARKTFMDTNVLATKSLIYAESCERIGIRGGGVIDGRGDHETFRKYFKPGEEQKPAERRPFLMRIIDSRKVVIDGIELRNAARWMQNYLACDDVILQNVRVENQANWNNDGMDIDGCRNVIVRNCWVNAGDDGICFKGAGMRRMENVLVENSKFYSTCNSIKFGTESLVGARNIVVRNCEAGGPSDEMTAFHRRPSHSGVTWETVDGADLENFLVTGVHMVRVRVPIFLRRGDRARVMPGMAHPSPGKLRRLIFDGITGEENGNLGGCIVAGIPGAPVEDVVIRNVNVSVAGGGEVQTAKPELVAEYPNAPMFNQAPGYGFWLRHARNIAFFNFSIKPQVPDARPFSCVDIDVEGPSLNGKPVPSNPPAPSPSAAP